MLVDFDKLGMAEKPVLTLAYPQGKELGQLGSYQDLGFDGVLNSYSTITFKYPYYGSENKKSNLYDLVESKMLLKAEGLGEYIVTECEETNTGTEHFLQITASTSEVQMCHRKINLLNGTYKFYDLLNPENTLLGLVLKYLPTWKIGYVSSELMSKYRTFDIPDSTLYDFLMNEASQTYECMFTFDTIKKEINAYTIEDITKASDIFIGYGSYLKSETVREVSDEMTTVMSCYGGDGVNIASVNPLGSVYLYNFDHFKHMMTDELRDALEQWENRYAELQVNYSELLAKLKETNSKLITAQANLKDAESKKIAAEGVQSVQISGGQTNTSNYQNTLKELADAEALIKQYQSEIAVIETKKKGIQEQQKSINDSLKFSTDAGIFSEENLLELEYFKFESTHQDDNFIVTDAMSIVEQQDMMEQLYEQSKKLIAQVSHPTYEITADAVNFLFIEKLAPFINKIYDPSKPETLKQLLGVKFNLEVEEDEWIEPVLLKFHVNFDNPTDFSLEFSNRYRLNDALWTYADLMGEAVSTSGNISFDYSSIKEWNSHRNDLVEFANNSLNMTRNNLVNNPEDQTFLIDHTGLRGHSVLEGADTGRGIWLTADTLAFSDDNFNTVRTAIGLIPTESGINNYGVNAEVLIGKMIFGSELTIANENNTMKMDGNGFTVETDYNRILINPDDGILIQKKNGSSYINQLYADNKGNLILEGNITANGGSVGGFNITENSISSPNGNIVLNSDGTATIGMMEVGKSSTTFSGNIYAKNIQYGGTAGTLSGSAITGSSITANQIAGSTITASEIKNGAITAGKIGSNQISYGSSCVDSDSFDAEFNTIIASKGYITEAEVGNLVATRIKSGNLTIDTGKTLAWSTGCSLTSNVAEGSELVLTVTNALKTTTVRCTNLYINNYLVRRATSLGQVPTNGYVFYTT